MVVIRSRSASELLATMEIASVQDLVSGGSTSTIELGDSQYERATGATIDHNAQVATSIPSTITSTNEEIATVTPAGKVNRVADGTAIIRVSNAYGTAELQIGVSREVNTVDTWQAYLAGSLPAHFAEQIWGRVDGVTPSVAKPLYSTYPARNPNCWCFNGANPLDVTCIVRGNPNRNGTAITRRAIIHAAHYWYNIGASVTLVGMDGTAFTTTVTDRVKIGSTDIALAKLADELPEYITPAPLMPADWLDYQTGVPGDMTGTTWPFPIVCTNRAGRLLTNDFNRINGKSMLIYAGGVLGTIQRELSAPCHEFIESGDSGSGLFAVVNDQLVSLGSFYTAYSMPLYSEYLTEIQDALTALDAGTFATVDLSGFPTH